LSQTSHLFFQLAASALSRQLSEDKARTNQTVGSQNLATHWSL